MKSYLLLVLMALNVCSLRAMEKPFESTDFPEITSQEIDEWFASLGPVAQSPLIPPLTLEPIITEPAPKVPELTIEELISFFEPQDNASNPDVVTTTIRPRILPPIDKVIRAIRCTSYHDLTEEIKIHPKVVNEKKQITICNLLRPPNCKKAERILQEVTPLIFSCYQKATYMVTQLLVNKADPNLPGHKGITPLLVVASNGCYEIAEQLLKAGADPLKTDTNNTTPLEIAHKRSNTIMCNLILRHIKMRPTSNYLEQRAWITNLFNAIADTDNPYSVHILTQPDTKKDIDALNLVEVQSIYSDSCSSRMITALHFAAYYANEKAVKILLAAGADPNVMEHYRVTPLHIAAAKGLAGIAHTLLENGAKKNVIENYARLLPAELAEKRGHVETRKIIMYHPS